MNFNNVAVTRTFVSSDSQNCWAHLQGIGWRKVRTGSTDGVTNVFISLTAARANNMTVSGTIHDATNQIWIVYL